jgi:hypothetical protein
MSAEIICPQCGYSKQVPEERISPWVKWANCPRCKNRFELNLPQIAPVHKEIANTEPARSTASQGAGWETRSETGWWKGLYRTTKSVLFSPRQFFGAMTVGTGLGEPFAYGLLSGVAGVMGGLFWYFLMMSGSLQSLIQLESTGMALVFAALLLLSIPYVLVALLLTSLVLHGCLVVVRDGRKGFEATFRVVAYSQAAQVFSFIPFVGGVAAFLWLIVVQVIGLREIHNTTYPRIVMAYLIPFILLFGIVAAVVLFLSFLFLR